MKTYNRNRLLLLLLVCVFPGHIFSQNISSESSTSENLYQLVNQKYGLNQVLVNGKSFEYIYRNDLGHPFFSDDEYKNGYLIIHNHKFENQSLKYNISNQSLVVLYINQLNSRVEFMPPFDFISEFSIDGHRFKKYSFANEEDRFYQEIYLGKINCLCYWKKQKDKSKHNITFMAYRFSDPKKEYVLVIDNKPYPFASKRTLLKLFPEYKKSIVQFMKEQDIKLKKSSGQQLAELIAFCDELSNSSSKISIAAN